MSVPDSPVPAPAPRRRLPRTGRARGVAERSPLPEGTFAVGVGLLVNGVAAYVFLALGARALGTDKWAPVASLWSLAFVLAPGFFLPVEQEVGRALAARRTLGVGGGPLVRRAAFLGAGLAGLIAIVVLALSPLLVDELFDGNAILVVALVVAVFSYALAHLGRGGLSGMRCFGAYGRYMAAEGLIRVGAAVVLLVVGIDAKGVWGLAIGLPALAAILFAARGERDRLLAPGPQAPLSELSTNLGWLLAGSVFAAALVNAGPLAVNLLAADGEKELAGRFFNCLIISRVPLFLFQAVQAALLPKLSALAAAGQFDEFRDGFRRLLVAVVGIAVAGTIGAFLFGSFAVSVLFGEEYDLGRRNLTMLALASGIYMIAVALAQALIALHGHARVAFGWGLGIVGLVTAIALGDDLLVRVEVGLVVGATVAAAAVAATLRSLLARPNRLDEAGIVEALHDLPLEP